MIEFFQVSLDILRYHIFIGFGLYSILFFIFKRWARLEKLPSEFDQMACKFIIYAGLLYSLLWISLTSFSYFETQGEIERSVFLKRFKGPLWHGFVFEPIYYIALTQLLWIKSFRKSLVYRVGTAFLFAFTFERIIRVLTSLHRDYLPSNWILLSSPAEMVVDLSLKALLFIVIISILVIAKRKSYTPHKAE